MKQKLMWCVALALCAVDRATKLLWAEADFVLLQGVVRIRGARNTGMSFGLLQGNAYLLAALSLAVILAALWLLRGRALSRARAAFIGLMLGGAAGNLIDRVAFGYVIDFIEPVFVRFPTFNVADAGVVCGAALLAVSLLFEKSDKGDTRDA